MCIACFQAIEGGNLKNWTFLFSAKHRIGSRYNNVIHNNRNITRRISNNASNIRNVTVLWNGISTIAALCVFIIRFGLGVLPFESEITL